MRANSDLLLSVPSPNLHFLSVHRQCDLYQLRTVSKFTSLPLFPISTAFVQALKHVPLTLASTETFEGIEGIRIWLVRKTAKTFSQNSIYFCL